MKLLALRAFRSHAVMHQTRKYQLLALVLLALFGVLFVADLTYNVVPGIPVSQATWATRGMMGVMLLSSVLLFVLSIESHFGKSQD